MASRETKDNKKEEEEKKRWETLIQEFYKVLTRVIYEKDCAPRDFK